MAPCLVIIRINDFELFCIRALKILYLRNMDVENQYMYEKKCHLNPIKTMSS